MMFWVFAIILTIIVMLAIYGPLNRDSKADTTKPAMIRALAAELDEVNSNNNERFASAAEADAARVEIGRRMLALEAAPQAKPAANHSQMFALFALLPILAVPLYLHLGQPEYADQFMATRMDAVSGDGQVEVAELISRVEERLKDRPEDGAGWAVIAPVYFRLGRIDDSLNAFAKAVEFHKGTPAEKSRLMADHAEVMVAKLDGKVSPEAATRFTEALSLNQTNQKPMFYLAMHLEQTGEPEAAKKNWEDLIARYKGDNPPWLEVATQRLAAMSAPVAPVLETPVSGGPTAGQIEAAGEMTREQREEMIKGMVEGLAAKMVDNPQDQYGWMKLIRARMVMNDRAKAQADLDTARSLFAPGTQGRAEIDAVAQSVGL